MDLRGHIYALNAEGVQGLHDGDLVSLMIAKTDRTIVGIDDTLYSCAGVTLLKSGEALYAEKWEREVSLLEQRANLEMDVLMIKTVFSDSSWGESENFFRTRQRETNKIIKEGSYGKLQAPPSVAQFFSVNMGRSWKDSRIAVVAQDRI